MKTEISPEDLERESFTTMEHLCSRGIYPGHLQFRDDLRELPVERLRQLMSRLEDFKMLSIDEFDFACCEGGLSPFFEMFDHAYRRVATELVRRTASPERPWTVTDECGEFLARVIGMETVSLLREQYFLFAGADDERFLADGLLHEAGGPWDGQHYTLQEGIAQANAVLAETTSE